MNYTYNWNQEFKKNTEDLKNLNLCLEIGCFEGLTSNYIIENILSENGKLFCVDPLTDNYLNTNLTETDVKNNQTIYGYFNNQYNRFTENVKKHIISNNLRLYRNISEIILPQLIKDYENSFDLIYIDGDHRASAVYLDGVNSFKLCKSGGIIIFDDYSWGTMYGDESTNKGIDRFIEEFESDIIVLIKGYQVVIKKK
jgi:predicted O-methyltransferase YrrM